MPSTDTLHSFWTATDRFTSVVTDAADADWSAASPCPGWSAADVLDHVLESQREFLTGRGLDLGPAPQGSPAERWQAHVAALRTALLTDPAVADREYDGYFGRTTIGATLHRFYGSDLLVHRWDLARALGADDRLTDEELDELEVDLEALGDAVYAEGVYGDPVLVPDDASRQVAVLARTGRRA